MNNRVIRDYIASLKEDKELDAIFPLLLIAMGFRIVSTPVSSKGQSQYGKDVIAWGKAKDGKLYRWYFELKGNAAKDIDDRTFAIKDGVRDSILAAKDTTFEEPGVPFFNNLPVKICFVHNGILKENTRPQYEGFINREFPDDGPMKYERWDIERLTEYFTKYLFDENLFCDEKSYKLLLKALILMDAPGWTTGNVDRVIDVQLDYCPLAKASKRLVDKTFAALSLLMELVSKYAVENENLLPAKQTSERVVLKTWGWILKNKKEYTKRILDLFNGLVLRHLSIYHSYIQKLIPLATSYKGLFQVGGGETEKVFYPMRCYDFLNDLLYYSIVVQAYNHDPQIQKNHVEMIADVIKNNSGFNIPLLDTNSITLLMLLRFTDANDKDGRLHKVVSNLIKDICFNVVLRHKDLKMWPELYGNRRSVAKSVYSKSEEYTDASSLFLMTLIEIVAWMDVDELYEFLRKEILESEVNLQVAFPVESDELEVKLFEKRLYDEIAVETSIELPEKLSDFKKSFRKRYNHIALRTEKTPFYFLIFLAHIHYQTDMFPDFVDFGFLERLENDSNSKGV